MRSVWLAGVVLVIGCGSDTVVVDPPLRCEPGAELEVSVAACELAIEGVGGPTGARVVTIASEIEPAWRSFTLADDGGLYLFANDEGAAIVARLDPSFAFAWSRAITHEPKVPDDQAWAEIRASAAGPEGVHVVAQRLSQPGFLREHDAAALLHVRDDGECGDSIALAFGGEDHGVVGNLVREPNRLVVAGAHLESGHWRSFVQQRSLDGHLTAEAEILDGYHDDVGSPWVRLGGSAHYLVSYSGYAPHGYYGRYSAGQVLDPSLRSIEHTSSSRYTADAFGRLYTTSTNAVPEHHDEAPPPPTIYHVTPTSTSDSPSGETIELEIPQPQCGASLTVALFDESLLVLQCNPPDSPSLLLGYEGSGPPTWT
ncbi:MAG TPA: hypothetical protein VM869_03030, partial [Enhygromyxa sp.]|nr:hypothetical protein [Enhygromyxa sp.]